MAEVGFNHNGDVDLAKSMLQAAWDHGADAVKLQTFNGRELYANSLMADDPENAGRRIPFYTFFERHQLSAQDYATLFAFARQRGILLFSTPFDPASLDMLVACGLPAVKIASGDLTYHDLLRLAGRTGLPVVLSSGMATEEEVGAALEVLRSAGARRLVLLHCVSSYPAAVEDMHLACLPRLRQRLQTPVGLSDHSLDTMPAVVATSLGAVMIEKHFTLSRDLPGVDQSLSMEPGDLRALKDATLAAHRILGDGGKRPRAAEKGARKGARRSVVARVDIPAGTRIDPGMLSLKRPGTGIPAGRMADMIGKTARRDIPAEAVLTWEMV